MKSDIRTQFFQAYEQMALRLLVEGYNAMLSFPHGYQIDWEEEQFSALLANKMENLPFALEKNIDVKCEIRIYGKSIVEGTLKPKEAPRIDIQLTRWFSQDKVNFNVETKNLSASNWQKTSGAIVSASNQRVGYINEGIKCFIDGHYPTPGCMIAYIVQGEVSVIIEKLNRLILQKNKEIGLLEVSPKIFGHLHNFQSTYTSTQNHQIILKHLFFPL